MEEQVQGECLILILAILLKKRLEDWYGMNYPEVYCFFLCKMYFILSNNFRRFVMFSETKFVY